MIRTSVIAVLIALLALAALACTSETEDAATEAPVVTATAVPTPSISPPPNEKDTG